MNYLAHILLSGEDMEIAVGNFMGDGVKGRIGERYPFKIRAGLYLHRYIDHMADTHEVNMRGRRELRSEFSHYSGVVLDMYHDHFLAKDWDKYCDQDIMDHLNEFYLVADRLIHEMPAREARFYQAARSGDWLRGYASLESMKQAFNGMSKRAEGRQVLAKAGEHLESHYPFFQSCFDEFFPLLVKECSAELERLLTSL